MDDSIKLAKELDKMFPNLPNPEHYPKQFGFYVKMFKRIKALNNKVKVKE